MFATCDRDGFYLITESRLQHRENKKSHVLGSLIIKVVESKEKKEKEKISHFSGLHIYLKP